jgi:hypothetical protein
VEYEYLLQCSQESENTSLSELNEFQLRNGLPNCNIGLKFYMQSDMTLLAACNGKLIDECLRDGQNQSRNLTCLLPNFNEQFRLIVSYLYLPTVRDCNNA